MNALEYLKQIQIENPRLQILRTRAGKGYELTATIGILPDNFGPQENELKRCPSITWGKS